MTIVGRSRVKLEWIVLSYKETIIIDVNIIVIRAILLMEIVLMLILAPA